MPTFEPFDWYESPAYYDMIFGLDTDHEAEFLDAMHAMYGLTKGKKLLEPACGSGRLVAAMAQRDWDVTGFDLAKGSLAFARKRLKKTGCHATLHHASMANFDCGKDYDLAHCMVSTFKYLLSEVEATQHLECVAESLKVGGIYVLGLHLSDYDLRSRQRERWTAEQNGVQVVCNIQTQPPNRRKRTEAVRSRLIVTEAGQTRRFECNWTFRTYSVRQLQSLLRSVAAFEHVATYDFRYLIDSPGKLDGTMFDNILILRRR